MSDQETPGTGVDTSPIVEETPDIEALFRFDPFEQESESPDSVEPAAAPETPSAPAPVETAPSPAPSAQPVNDAAAQLARASEMLSGLVTRQLTTPAQSAPAAPAKPAEEEDDIPQFHFQLPAEIVDALYGEDAVLRAQALNALFRGVARTVYRQQRDDYRAYLEKEFAPRIRSQVTEETQQRAIVEDFYGTYPQLNTPGLRALVVEEMPYAARELGVTSWTPALKQKLYERVVNRVRSVAPPPEVPAVAPTPPPAVRSGSSARPAAGPPKDDIASILGL